MGRLTSLTFKVRSQCNNLTALSSSSFKSGCSTNSLYTTQVISKGSKLRALQNSISNHTYKGHSNNKAGGVVAGTDSVPLFQTGGPYTRHQQQQHYGKISNLVSSSPFLFRSSLLPTTNFSQVASFHTSRSTMSAKKEHDSLQNSNHTHSDHTHSHEKHEIKPTEHNHQHEHKHLSNGHSHSHEHSHDHSHSLFSHSHSHSSGDSVFLQEHGGLKNPAIRITVLGLLVNLSMAIGKGIGGVVFHSQALLADSIHALSDLVSDFLTLATVSVAAKKPTSVFPNGYGKIETLGSLGVSALLLLAGISVGWSGLISLIQQLFGDTYFVELLTQFFGHGHSHSHINVAAPSVNDVVSAVSEDSGHGHSHSHSHSDAVATPTVDLKAMWLALASIAAKEWLFKATMKIAKETNSTVLVANAWHHRIDSLTSVVAVATIGGSYMFGLNWLDSLGGIIVSSVIIQAGARNGYAAALELADSTKTIPEELYEQNREAAEVALTKAVSTLNKQNVSLKHGDFEIYNILILSSGPNYTVQVDIKSNSNNNQSTSSTGIENTFKQSSQEISVSKFTKVSEIIQKEMLSHDPRLKRVIVQCIDENNTIPLDDINPKEK